MRVYKEINSYGDLDFWGYTQDIASTTKYLTIEELEEVWKYLESVYDEMEESEICEFFLYEKDFIAELLGYGDFDKLLDRDNDE